MPYYARDLGAGSGHSKCNDVVNGSSPVVSHLTAQLTSKIPSFHFTKATHFDDMQRARWVMQAGSSLEELPDLAKGVRRSNNLTCQSKSRNTRLEEERPCSTTATATGSSTPHQPSWEP